jgi:hypothetical protein
MEQKYNLGINLTSEQLQSAAQQVFADLQTDERLRSGAAKFGIDLAAFDAAMAGQDPKKSVVVEPTGAGLTPDTVAVIVKVGVAFAPVVATVMKDTWTHFVLPWLKRKFGDNSITEDPSNKKD